MNDDVDIVAARAEHHADFVRLFRELGVDDPLPPVERWLVEMAADSFFLVEGGRAVAYGYGNVLADSGYVRHVAVEPQQRGRGLGRRLMLEHARRFREAACERWQLNVLASNAVAIALYRSLGMEIDFTTWVVRIAPSDVARLPNSKRRTQLREVRSSEDAALEAKFDLSRGLLDTFRCKHGQQVLALFEVGDPERAPLGVARFDPAYPGCFPFCVVEPSLARNLIEPLLPQIAPSARWIQFVIERDRPLTSALLDAGATVHFEIVHMSGTLPRA